MLRARPVLRMDGRLPRLMVMIGFGLMATGAAGALHLHVCDAEHDHTHCTICLQAGHAAFLTDGPTFAVKVADVTPAPLGTDGFRLLPVVHVIRGISPRAPPP